VTVYKRTLLRMISGARYSGVPHNVHVLPLTRFAKPKSVTWKQQKWFHAFTLVCITNTYTARPMQWTIHCALFNDKEASVMTTVAKKLTLIHDLLFLPISTIESAVGKRLITHCCVSRGTRLACSRLSGHIEPHSPRLQAWNQHNFDGHELS